MLIMSVQQLDFKKKIVSVMALPHGQYKLIVLDCANKWVAIGSVGGNQMLTCSLST